MTDMTPEETAALNERHRQRMERERDIIKADVHTVIAGLLDRPPMQHVVVTGRAAPPELIEVGDTVTGMNVAKHAFKAGIAAQAGTKW
jgi:ATP:corrinoid adenosyltransferase